MQPNLREEMARKLMGGGDGPAGGPQQGGEPMPPEGGDDEMGGGGPSQAELAQIGMLAIQNPQIMKILQEMAAGAEGGGEAPPPDAPPMQ